MVIQSPWCSQPIKMLSNGASGNFFVQYSSSHFFKNAGRSNQARLNSMTMGASRVHCGRNSVFSRNVFLHQNCFFAHAL